MSHSYPIGIPGKPWTNDHKKQWFERQEVKRSYRDEVLSKLDGLEHLFEIIQYGALPFDQDRYPLMALKSINWSSDKPTVLVTGGVHGYETSGVQGAIRFAHSAAKVYVDQFNLVIAPCVSPWGYETINRWDPAAIDPNRSFFPDSSAPDRKSVV